MQNCNIIFTSYNKAQPLGSDPLAMDYYADSE